MLAAIDAHADDHGHHDHCQHDQVVADLQHGLLEVADGDGRLHQFRGLAEVGLATRRIDQRGGLAATDDRPGEHGVAGFAGLGQGFPGERRLIDGDLVAVQKTRIGRHDVAQAQANGVARHELARWRVDPFAVALDPGLDRQPGLQGLDGVARLAFFPKAHRGIGNQQQQDDEEVGPVAHHAGQHHRDLDHPGDGSPEIGEKLQQRVGLLLDDLVRPVLGQPLLGLGVAQPFG